MLASKSLFKSRFLGFLLRWLTLNVPGSRRFLVKTLYAVPCKAASQCSVGTGTLSSLDVVIHYVLYQYGVYKPLEFVDNTECV
jgi:hypothetical protein